MVIILYLEEVLITITLSEFIGSDATCIQFIDLFMYTYHYDWNKQEIAI